MATKVEAIKKLMKDNGGLATWEIIYNEIEKYYPYAKKSKEWQAGLRGVLYRDLGKNFKRIGEGIYTLLDYDEKRLVLDKDKKIIKDTEKDIMSHIRIGQQFFRDRLIKSLKSCPITGINETKILVASHIKPWAMSSNQERLDILNGFIFTPTFDKLFDTGLISFTNEKELLISKELSKDNINKLGITHYQRIEKLPINGRENYLLYHRDKIFRE
jgi:putative restriction endonuclease